MSIVEDTCAKIASNPAFLADYAAIVKQSVLGGAGLPREDTVDQEALRRLVQSAALFAQTENAHWRSLAYRICIGALEYKKELGGIEEAARLTLSRLGNFPAINFAFRGTVEPKSLPLSVFFEISRRKTQNTVQFGDGPMILTDMQKKVWDTIISGSSIALSAPTSAGKSFVFQSYVDSRKRINPLTQIVFLVPTRALIGQVAAAIGDTRIGSELGVVTVPIQGLKRGVGTPIYVLTPERLQTLLLAEKSLQFDLVIVDEAQLIADRSRGVTLYSALQDLKDRNPSSQILFSSPQVRTPDIFGQAIGDKELKVIKSTESPVAQNIILLNGDDLNPLKISAQLSSNESRTILSEFDSSINIYNSSDRLIYAAWSLGQNSQSLVYGHGPGTCEEISSKLVDLGTSSGDEKEKKMVSDATREARIVLSNFAKESVHDSYLLAETVISGVGFHYGRMPTLLRSAVEDLFSAGHLEYIVCTSTLLQGVNLPARNIFMHNPVKGDDIPIDPVEFWNLAGRAGRLGKDFQGNVFLIDYDKWDAKPLSGPKDNEIKPAIEIALSDEADGFLNYIERRDAPSGESPLFESVFTKLLRDFRRGKLSHAFDQISTVSADVRSAVTAALENATKGMMLSDDTLDASPLISAYRQDELYQYMKEKIRQKGPDYLIPPHPSSEFRPTLEKMWRVFARVHRYIEKRPGNHHRFWAPLALRWMRGDSLPLIIENSIDYWKKEAPRRDRRRVIRDVLKDIETGLRFRYVNLLGCYTAILKQALADLDFSDYVARIPALTLYLELGASSGSMVQLLGMGLSRHAAGKVANLSVNRDMDAGTARSFVQRLRVESSGLSPYIGREVERLQRALNGATKA